MAINDKRVYGVGINDADYKVTSRIDGKQVMCIYFRMWKNMLGRCYHKNVMTLNPSYVKCTVSTSWLKFSNFKSWAEKQKIGDKHLDKDFLIFGNTEYSSRTCWFLSRHDNSLLHEKHKSVNNYLTGVIYYGRGCRLKRWNAVCYVDNKRKSLGYFHTEIEAHEAYCSAKASEYLKAANRTSNGVEQDAWRRHAERLLK